MSGRDIIGYRLNKAKARLNRFKPDRSYGEDDGDGGIMGAVGNFVSGKVRSSMAERDAMENDRRAMSARERQEQDERQERADIMEIRGRSPNSAEMAPDYARLHAAIDPYGAMSSEADVHESANLAPVGGMMTPAGAEAAGKEAGNIAHDANLGRSLIAQGGMMSGPVPGPQAGIGGTHRLPGFQETIPGAPLPPHQQQPYRF